MAPPNPPSPAAARAANGHGPVYQAVLDWCTRPPRFPSPWDFVEPPAEAAGPIVEVDRATADLLERYPAKRLRDAGVMRRTYGPHHRLSPELVNPCGAVLPLRTHPAAPVFGLLTGRGLLPRRYFAFGAVRTDHWTRRRLSAGLPLFASPFIRDVLLLRALGFPAVTTAGLATAGTSVAATLDERFGWPGGTGDTGESPRGPLALVGCTLFPPTAGPPPGLVHAAARLADLRRHFGFALAGVAAWVPTAAETAALALAVQLREPRAGRLTLCASAEALVDFEVLAGRPAPPAPSYPDALDALLTALAAGTEPAPHAWEAYLAAARRDLVRPQLDRAVADPDPAAAAARAALG